jgi:hypothetical protein
MPEPSSEAREKPAVLITREPRSINSYLISDHSQRRRGNPVVCHHSRRGLEADMRA